MIMFFAALLLLAIFGLKGADGEDRDYMSVKMTNGIKGFFICMVLFSHIWSYVGFSHAYLDRPYEYVKKTGQCIVVMFLFYSGYGIMESIKKKGQDYVRRIPIQRFLKVLLQFDCAVVFYLIYRYMTDVHYDIRKILLSFVAWETVGNERWYIFCILCIYVFTFLSFRVFKDNYVKGVLGVFICSLLYIAAVCRVRKGEYWWYDTVLCYTGGMFYSLYRRRIESFINESKNSWRFFLAVFAVGYVSTYFYKNSSPVLYQLWVFCFGAAIVTFTMRFVVDSVPLRWMGERLFEIYILHRLFMMILYPYVSGSDVSSIRKYVYIVLCFLLTLLSAVIYRKTVGKAVNKITGKKFKD